ncbi:MAG: hypothetical protein LBI42_13610 [Chitinispirillales bacterium]|nr:hypothetical protein [Chitinispirillales bacterium]
MDVKLNVPQSTLSSLATARPRVETWGFKDSLAAVRSSRALKGASIVR